MRVKLVFLATPDKATSRLRPSLRVLCCFVAANSQQPIEQTCCFLVSGAAHANLLLILFAMRVFGKP